ncbi:MAG: carbohydrate porin [Gammaproteobacteria bacterium]|nr:carbohydrate porin [Gammaproteobacteria bacterium]
MAGRLLCLLAAAGAACAGEDDSRWPQLLAAQYTYILQQQSTLRSPYQGPLSLDPRGDTQATHTVGFYGGWAPLNGAELYLDTEKFMGAGVSGATGLAGLTNGDVVRQGVVGLKKQFYIARAFAHFVYPLGGEQLPLERAQDQLPGVVATRRLELKAGRMAVNDDFDRNRYAGSPRTQFLNWSLWANTAWDFAANTRGYTDGFMLAWFELRWALRFGLYRMPLFANGQTLETLARANSADLELTLTPVAEGPIVRLLAYRNRGRMGDYRAALERAAMLGVLPNVAADDRDGRHKTGFGLNAELPVADEGATGLFLRLGADDGATESFIFTEVDRQLSLGAQLGGIRWRRPADVFGAGLTLHGLAGVHRDYLAAGGTGFLLGDGRLNYAHEQILETYYRAQLFDAVGSFKIRLQLSPDIQYVRNPGYNADRGPVWFYGVRLHLEY